MKAIPACRRLVGHFKHSITSTVKIVKRQETMQMPFKKLIQDSPRRWKSTFYMVEQLLDLHWPISAILLDESVMPWKDSNPDLTNRQWNLLNDLKKVL